MVELDAALAAQLMSEVVATQALHREIGGISPAVVPTSSTRTTNGVWSLAATWASRMNRATDVLIGQCAGMEQLDRGFVRTGDREPFVDLTHPATTDQHAELERADDLVGEPPRATDLERAIELCALRQHSASRWATPRTLARAWTRARG